MSTIQHLAPAGLTYVQSREAGNFDLIEEYASLMRDGVEFDPASAVRDDAGTIYVYDGFHRGEAAKRAGVELAVEMHTGDRQQAEWLALSANQKHGLRRTRDDKRRAVRLALLHPAGATLSDREIGRHCGVDHKTVGRVRSELETTGEIPQSDVRTGADGREIDTARIGGQPARGPRNPQLEIWEIERKVKSLLGDTFEETLEAIKARTPEGIKHLEGLEDAIPGQYRRDVRQACNNLLDQLHHIDEPAPDWLLDQPGADPGAATGDDVPECPNCGHEIIDLTAPIQCPNCGIEIVDQAAHLDALAAGGSEATVAYCPKCGWDMTGIEGDCPNCAEEAGAPGAAPKKGKYIVNVVGNLAGDPSPTAQPPAGEFDCPRCGRERVVKTNGGAWCLACSWKWQAVESFHEERAASSEAALRPGLVERFGNLVDLTPAEQLGEIDAWLDDLERAMARREEQP